MLHTLGGFSQEFLFRLAQNTHGRRVHGNDDTVSALVNHPALHRVEEALVLFLADLQCQLCLFAFGDVAGNAQHA